MPSKPAIRRKGERKSDIYAIAHTAQCKLSMTAGEPDRNLRFILGHAFLLDNMLLRVAKMEQMDDDDIEQPNTAKDVLSNELDETGVVTASSDAVDYDIPPPEGQSGSLSGGKVKFHNDTSTGVEVKEAIEDDDDRPTYSDEERDYDDGEGQSLGSGLTRFESASAAPPRMIDDTGSDDEEEEGEALTPPSLPADFDYRGLMATEPDEEFEGLFDSVRGCPCHGRHLDETAKPTVKGVWTVNSSDKGAVSGKKVGDDLIGERVAVIKVQG